MKKTMQNVMEFINKNEKAIKLVGYSVYMVVCLVTYMKFLERILPETVDINLLADDINESLDESLE